MKESDRPMAAVHDEQGSDTGAPLREVRGILVFSCNLLGDSICRLPAIEAAKDTYREAHLVVVADPVYREVFEGRSFIDEVWPLSRRGSRLRQAQEWLGLMRRVRRARPDLVLDLYGSKRTAFASWVSGARFRTGLHRDGLSRWYNLADRVHADALHRGHIIERINAAVAPAGIAARFSYCRIPIGDDERTAARQLLGDSGPGEGEPIVLLNPSARVSAKRWPIERFARLAESLAARPGARCRVITAPGEQALAQRAVAGSRGAAAALPEMSIRMLAAVLEEADLLVTGDTGVLHLSAAMGTPSVVLAGPTDPLLFANPEGRQVILFHREACERWEGGEQCAGYNECPDRRCIEAITVDEAAAAVQRLLRG
jgi:ADP-heptose:LPS heptosyltransferase